MKRTRKKHNGAVLLIQAENDYDLTPSRALDEELKQANGADRAAKDVP